MSKFTAHVENVVFDRGDFAHSMERMDSSINNVKESDYAYGKKLKSLLYAICKLWFVMNQILREKDKYFKFLEYIDYLYDLEL